MMLVLMAASSLSLSTVNFWDNQPDGTILIHMDRVNKSNDWREEGDEGAGYGQWTNSVNEWFEASFVGDFLYIYGSKISTYGTFVLYIDGEFNQIVNCNNGGDRVNHVELVSVNLAPKYHTVRIVVNKGPVTIDGLYFKPGGLRRIDFASISYHGSWGDDTDNTPWNGENLIGKHAKTHGSYFEEEFTSYYFMICGTITHNYFSVDLIIDGVNVTTLNTLYRKRNLKAMLFSYLLPPGSHRVKYVSNGGLVGFSGLYLGNYIADSLSTDDFFENHPDETILISMNMMRKSDGWSDDTTAGYGQFTNQADQWAETSFVGSKFSIYGVKGPDQGSFDLYIDGNLDQSVNTNAESRTNHVQLFDIYLVPGYHTVKIIVTNLQVSIDGVYFKPEGLKRIPFDSLTYSEGWTIDEKQWGGEQSVGNSTSTADNYIEHSFNAEYLLISGSIGPGYSNVDISINSSLIDTINCENPKKDVKAMLITYELPLGTHTVRFSYKDGMIGFSGFYIGKYYSFHKYTEFATIGRWATIDNNHQWTDTPGTGQSMEILIKCSRAVIKGIFDPNHGYMEVFINDAKIDEINTYSSSRVENAILYSFTLPLDTHKIKLARKAGGKDIDIYGMYVLDNLDAGVINFEMSQYIVDEGNEVTINVVRAGSNGPTSVDVAFIDGTAKNNDHYIGFNKTIEFLGGETSKTLTITTINKALGRIKNNTFTCQLLNPKHFAILGDKNKTEVVIMYSLVPTKKFTRSIDFSNSNKFTISDHFLNTQSFIPSNIFSETNVFLETERLTESNKFWNTNAFSKSIHFSDTSHFAETNIFGHSTKFSISNEFGGTKKFLQTSLFAPTYSFGQSTEFSITNTFEKSFGFSASNDFPTSRNFDMSKDFSYSEKFSFTRGFTETCLLSESQGFSVSNEFADTNDFDYSNKFSISNFLEDTCLYSKSIGFSTSEDFIKTNKFNFTIQFSISSAFVLSNDFEKSKEFSRSQNFQESNQFMKSHIFSITSDISCSNIFIRTNRFSIPSENGKSAETSEKLLSSIIGDETSFQHDRNTICFSSINNFQTQANEIESSYIHDKIESSIESWQITKSEGTILSSIFDINEKSSLINDQHTSSPFYIDGESSYITDFKRTLINSETRTNSIEAEYATSESIVASAETSKDKEYYTHEMSHLSSSLKDFQCSKDYMTDPAIMTTIDKTKHQETQTATNEKGTSIKFSPQDSSQRIDEQGSIILTEVELGSDSSDRENKISSEQFTSKPIITQTKLVDESLTRTSFDTETSHFVNTRTDLVNHATTTYLKTETRTATNEKFSITHQNEQTNTESKQIITEPRVTQSILTETINESHTKAGLVTISSQSLKTMTDTNDRLITTIQKTETGTMTSTNSINKVSQQNTGNNNEQTITNTNIQEITIVHGTETHPKTIKSQTIGTIWTHLISDNQAEASGSIFVQDFSKDIPGKDDSSSSGGSSAGMIVGIVVGVIMLIVVIVILLYFFVFKKDNYSTSTNSSVFDVDEANDSTIETMPIRSPANSVDGIMLEEGSNDPSDHIETEYEYEEFLFHKL